MSQNTNRLQTRTTKTVIVMIGAAGLSAFAFSLYSVAAGPLQLNWILLILVAVLSLSRIELTIPRTPSVVRMKDLFIFLSVLLFGPMHSVVLAGADAAISSRNQRKDRGEILFNMALMSLPVFVSGWLVNLAFGQVGQLQTGETLVSQAASLGRMAAAAGMLVVVYYAVKAGFDSLVAALKYGNKLLRTWRESFMWRESIMLTALPYLAMAALSVAVKLAADLAFDAVIISVLLMATAYLTYKVYAEKVEATNLHAQKMADLHLRTIEALAIAVDAKDEVTHDHVFRVQCYATGLARLFGLSEPEVEALKAGALLHDIGKIAVPDYILNKPGKLTPAEFEEMKLHTVIGAQILERVSFPYPVVPVVRHHHERWDGRGYPDGLKGEEIPVTARIISVVDCFDAVREDRQYRKAMTRDEAIELIKTNSGTMYDPMVVEAFIEHLPEFEAEIRRHKLHASNEKRKTGLLKIKPQGADQQLLDQLRSAHGDVGTLYNVVQAIGTTLDLRDALTLFSTRLQDMVSYTTSILYLMRQDSTEIEAVHAWGRNAEALKGRRISLGAGISGWVVANGHPMHNSDPRLDFDAMKAQVAERYRTSTVVPLLKNGRVLGAVAVYSIDSPTYSVEQLRLLEAVAKLMSDAITKAASGDRKDAVDLTDKLTGLATAHALRQRFELEADRAERHGENFSIVMMDVDGFKNMNKVLGEQDADHLLWEVASLLSKLVQPPNFVCRYSGDRFVAMIEGDPEEVIQTVRHIQRSIDTHDFGFASSNIFIGMSLGFASYGGDGRTLDELLVAATRAMTADKMNRRTVPSGPLALKTAHLDQYKVM